MMAAPLFFGTLFPLVLVAILFGYFQTPSALIFLVFPGFWVLFQLRGDTLARDRAKILLGSDLVTKQLPRVNPWQLGFKRYLLFLGGVFIVMGLADPRWGFHWEEVHRVGSDLVIALDISDSMLAEDLAPNRLAMAKRKIGDLLTILNGDRVGMVVFSGIAFKLCPLTLDYGAVAMFLDDIDTEFLPLKGTNIAEALKSSLESFNDFSRQSKAILLITDGEQNEGEVLAQAKEAREKGVKIFCIGIGNPAKGGVPIPQPGGGVRKDRAGNIILTKLDESLLTKIALETGGGYKLTESGDFDLIKIYQEIRQKVERQDLESQRKKVLEHRFQWFLALSGLLILWSIRINPELTRESRGLAREGTA